MSSEGSSSSTKQLPKKKRVVSSQLRLSKVDQTTNDDSKGSSPTSPHVRTELPDLIPQKRPPNKPIIRTVSPKTYNDFDIDLTSLDTSTTQVSSLPPLTEDGQHYLEESHGDEKHHEVTKAELKKASELTSIFLDTRKLLSVERNVVDPTSETPEKLQQDSLSNIKISRGTLIRAEKVKTTLAVKYLYIQRTYEWNEQHKDTNEHPGVEGVYNPIQIIRNRKIRNKYNEHPQPLIHMKTIPLACNVFSLHNAEAKYDGSAGRKRKHWKMMWAIDLNEFVGDPRWRVNHWNELKDPHGNLWFPNLTPDEDEEQHSHSQSAGSSKKKIFTLKSKHGDKLTDEDLSQAEHEYDEFSGIKLRNHNRKISMEAGSSSDTDLHNFKITRSKSPKRHKIRNKMKKFYAGGSNGSSGGGGNGGGGGDSSSSSNAINEFSTTEERQAYAEKQVASERQEMNDNDPLAKQFFKRLTPPTFEDSDSMPSELALPQIRVEPTTPTSKFDEDDEMPDINMKQSVLQVEFIPSDKRGSSELHTHAHSSSEGTASGSAITGEDETGDGDLQTPSEDNLEVVKAKCDEIFDERELIFQNIALNLEYFQQYVNLRSQYLLTVYPNYLEVVDKKVQQVTRISVYDILTTISKINDDYIPAYEDLYAGFMEEIKSVIHMVNDVYSIKIDTLLSASDRSISEINASLSLDLRKITERLDYLDQSISANVFHGTLLKKKSISNVGWIYKVLYSCLENFIIIALRAIWIVVNIYKAFKYVVLLLWKFVKFIFW